MNDKWTRKDEVAQAHFDGYREGVREAIKEERKKIANKLTIIAHLISYRYIEQKQLGYEKLKQLIRELRESPEQEVSEPKVLTEKLEKEMKKGK